ncbi:solute carrier family 23 member 1 [Ciona intestinalis]
MSSTSTDPESDEATHKLAYGIEDTPPWYLSLVLGFQHYLTMFGSTLAVPLILSGSLCISNNDLAKSQLISTGFFVGGIVTIMQTLLGTRLPIIQGAAFSFLTPAIAIMSSAKYAPCPILSTNTSVNDSIEFDWKPRMLEVQGAILVASCLQVFIGLTGIIGFLMSYIGPLTVAPTITLVGLSLFGTAADNFAGTHWGISFMTMAFIIIFSQHLRNVGVPLPVYTRGKGWTFPRVYIFSLFPVIIGIMFSWAICGIITAAGGFPSSSEVYGYAARTDIRLGVLDDAPWFRVPYPGQWGVPVVTLSGVLGMISGVLASIIESVGDYYACARLCRIPSPPHHAVNRGIFMEGIGCILAGAWGTGSGTTSYSENIGAIGITKVGSRRVVQAGAIIMIILAVIGKFGALFTTIPDPIVGGMFCVMFGMIAAVGMSSLQFVDLDSSRNLLIMGFSTFMGIALPEWVKKNNQLIRTGVPELDQIFIVLLQTGMFVAGVLGFVLDNTIPGTDKERGLLAWRKLQEVTISPTTENNQEANTDTHESISSNPQNQEAKTPPQPSSVYNLPFGWIDNTRCASSCNNPSLTKVASYVPICPSFRKRHSQNDNNSETIENQSAVCNTVL